MRLKLWVGRLRLKVRQEKMRRRMQKKLVRAGILMAGGQERKRASVRSSVSVDRTKKLRGSRHSWPMLLDSARGEDENLVPSMASVKNRPDAGVSR